MFDYEINDLSVQLFDLSELINNDQIIHWEWNFSDGFISNEIAPNYTFNDYGNYEISLIVMSEYGLYSSPHIEMLEIVNLLDISV